MDEKYSDLAPETALAITETLNSQVQESFSKVVETDKWLSQHNFLVNSGGAIAVLGYLGTSAVALKVAMFPLGLFIVGIACSGIEIRALLKFYDLLHADALRRRSGFVDNEITVKEAATVSNVQGFYTKVNHWAGVIAQTTFVLGSLIGLIMLIDNAL